MNSIESSAINNLVSLAAPPNVIKRIFDMVMILLNEKVKKVEFDSEFTRIENAIQSSWELSKKVAN